MELSLSNITDLVAAKIAATHEVKEVTENITVREVSLYYVELEPANIENTIAENIVANIVANALSETELSYLYNIINLFVDESLETGVGVAVDYAFGVN